MLNLRYIIRLTSAFFARFKAILIIGVIFGILFFLFLRFVAPSLLLRKVETIGITGRFRTDNLPREILNEISDGLTKITEEGVTEPALATSWETPDKGKTWVFTLDQKEWQDGKKLLSEDITYNFSDVEIERPDDKTVIFKLQDPFSPFPVVVSEPVFKRGLLGTGEWKVTKATVAGGFIQKLEMVNKKKDKKIYKFYPTEERTKLAYKLGAINTIKSIFNPSPFVNWKQAKVTEIIDRTQVVTIFFNTQDAILADKSTRQALNYAINKKELDGERAVSPISPNSWAYNPQVKKYLYDTDRAKELLDNLPDELLDNLEIKLATSPVLLPVAEKIAKDWEAIGVKTVVQVSSSIPIEYQAYLAIIDIPADPDQYSIWHSTQEASNISNFQDPRIDKLLEDGRIEIILEERKKIYLDFQRFIVEDLPAAFLYHPTNYKVERK